MKISIIIPTYKPKDYIWQCLESIRKQTFEKSDFEIVLVLNGCNEPYYTHLDRYFKLNMSGYNVNFIQTDVGGVSKARNLALSVSKGDYITFIDDDDYISPYFLEELYANVSNDIVSVCRPIAFLDNSGTVIPYTVTKMFDAKNKLGIQQPADVRKFFAAPWMKLISKEIINGRQFDESLKNGEDTLFMFLISDRIKGVKCTDPKAVYYRRMRSDSAAFRKRSYRDRIANSVKISIKILEIFLKAPRNYNFRFFVTRILGVLKPRVKLF